MMKGLAARAFVAAFLPLVACTSTVPPSEEPGPEGPPDPSGLPEVPAEDLGQLCTGFGTGIDEITLFVDERCAAGSCLVDARTGDTFESYCSADCSKVRCPSGYHCDAVTRPKGTYACFRDPPPTNPDGVAYPTDHIGWKPRNGDVRGDRIPNLTFTGFTPDSTTTTTINLADFYDPTRKWHDVIYLVGVAGWDLYSPQSLQAVKSAKTFPRLAVIAVLGEGGSVGKAATLDDLTTVRKKFPWATNALDPGFKLLNPAFDQTAVPLTMVIDARTMEIAYGKVGALTEASKVDTLVREIRKRPAAY